MSTIDPDTLVKTGNVDGYAWADSFVQHFHGREVCHKVGEVDRDSEADISEIHGWFANAIENGKNHEAAKTNPERPADAITLTSTFAINAVIKGADPEDLLDSVRTAIEWAADEIAARDGDHHEH